MPLYRQESTLPEAEPLVRKWEDILAKFKLADYNLSFQDVQWQLPGADHRPFEDRHELLNQLDKAGAEDNKENFHTVPIKHTRRDVPFWANSDSKISAFLLHRHPGICTKERPSRKQRGLDARAHAAETVACIYLAYRCGWSNKDIGVLLGVEEFAIKARLTRIKEEADVFFAKRVPAKDVLIHNCFVEGTKQPAKCKCKLFVNHDDALLMVRRGEAEWLWVFPPKGKAYQSHGAVVAVRAKKTPRVMTIEKANMQRSAEQNEEEKSRLEIYGQMNQEMLKELIVPYVPDPFEGRAVITQWGDQRTANN